MKRSLLKLAILAIAAVPVWAADDFKLPLGFDKLAERAIETVDVTLDQSTLGLAGAFLSKSDPEEAQVKKLIGKLKGIYVRSFEFGKEGQYSQADLDAIRTQLMAPNWSRIVGVRNIKGENSEIYILKDGDRIGGLLILDAEPKELTLVHIAGEIDPDDLSRLSGHMGIPNLGTDKKMPKSDSNRRTKPDKNDEDPENF